MVPISKNIDIAMESRLPQDYKNEYDSDNNMLVHVPSLGVIPP